MKKIQVSVKEKKSVTNYTIANVWKEIKDMYQDTVWYASKDELRLCFLFVFLETSLGDKCLLDVILDTYLNKLINFDKKLWQVKWYLKKWDYNQIKIEAWVDKALNYDILFILLETIANWDDFKEKANKIYKKELSDKMTSIYKQHTKKINNFLYDFKVVKIQDDRYDDGWNHHDLSKSVYRTIYMRMSRKLTIPLQKNAKFKVLKSNSPLHLEFIQSVWLDFITFVRENLHVIDYLIQLGDDEVNKFLQKVIASAKEHTSLKLDIDIDDYILMYLAYRLWSKDKKKKMSSKEKKEESQRLDEVYKVMIKSDEKYQNLIAHLQQSITNTEKALLSRISKLEWQIEAYNSMDSTKEIKWKIKYLEKEVLKLRNISVEIREKEWDDS